MNNRIQRVNALIKDELNNILLKEVDFPKDVLVTITRVESSTNLSQAKIYISVMSAGRDFPEKSLDEPAQQTDKVLEILNRKIYDIQQALNKRLRMRPIPKIQFKKEEKTEEAARIEELLEDIKDGDES